MSKKVKVKFDLPELITDVEVLKREFRDKVVDPFNKIFSQFKTPGGAQFFEFNQKDFDDEEAVAYGDLYCLSTAKDFSTDKYKEFEITFYKNGRAVCMPCDSHSPQEKEKIEGSWEYIMNIVLDLIRKELLGLKRMAEEFDRLSKGVEI